MTTQPVPGYDPPLPWSGLGSPCGNLRLQRRRAARHAHSPKALPGVFIDFHELADCRECEMCGGCQTHEGCLSDLLHLEWAMYNLPHDDRSER